MGSTKKQSPSALLPAPDPRQAAPRREEVARYARELWERYGRPSGRDEEIWLEAERRLFSRDIPTGPPRDPSESGRN